eukprot:5969598-Lingulodinium_polyedra.AAC.1
MAARAEQWNTYCISTTAYPSQISALPEAVTKTTLRARWWKLSSLEGFWGLQGGPRCPLSAADSSAAAG